VEFDGHGLQRLLLWVTLNQLFIGCLYGAIRGTFTGKRYGNGKQHGGSEQISVRSRNHHA
jgi:hypothetical protein